MSQQETANRHWKEKERKKKCQCCKDISIWKLGQKWFTKITTIINTVFSAGKLGLSNCFLILMIWLEIWHCDLGTTSFSPSISMQMRREFNTMRVMRVCLNKKWKLWSSTRQTWGGKAASCWAQVWDVVTNVILRGIFLNLKLQSQTVLCSHMNFTRLCQNPYKWHLLFCLPLFILSLVMASICLNCKIILHTLFCLFINIYILSLCCFFPVSHVGSVSLLITLPLLVKPYNIFTHRVKVIKSPFCWCEAH